LFVYIFFFPSRRRYTISKRDWSSDVCSSDLRKRLQNKSKNNGLTVISLPISTAFLPQMGSFPECQCHSLHPLFFPLDININQPEIGRASCRDRRVSGQGRGR